MKDAEGKIVIGAVAARTPRWGSSTSVISAKSQVGQCQVTAGTITCRHLPHRLPMRRPSFKARKNRDSSPQVCW